ncbi:autotransporter outer membrane beta-barrel domain-containing protein [Pseudomonas mediterranea]|uniref:autotransporter outer membrane beta-barrel domain-containing protein n=1 Tax=Pseudomonas mediterranea TaxID=183795 RepID=UPI002234207B|nr:autotransporter outer membrane beta-barrel domain-containing protein [Pseudomonas mediterranea]UZD99059.1 autotransporter outer membrane beta-barrel domain-containing protein [Pseudomonas mediterranea]
MLLSGITPVSCSLVLSMLVSTSVQADLVENGEIRDIAPGTPSDRYSVITGSTLNVNGADILDVISNSSTINVRPGSTTQQIWASNGSRVELEGATVTATGTGGIAGVRLEASQATIGNSTVTNANGIGLHLLQSLGVGSSATVSGSVIKGSDGGAFASALSTLDVRNSHIEGTGADSYGVRLFSADATFTNSTIIGGLNGLDLRGNRPLPREGNVLLDGTTVEGKTGAAIRVVPAGAASTEFNIDLTNGANLIAGNGNLLEAVDGVTVNMNVSNSGGVVLKGNVDVSGNSTVNLGFDQGRMEGDFIVESGSTGTLGLANGSLFKGNLVNVSGVTINSGSEWEMAGDNTVGALALSGGTVAFGGASEFYQLNVGTLAGDGTFKMDVDWATNQHDVLNVTGVANGNHALLVQGSGVDPVSAQALTLVKTAAGDATFGLVGDQVDVGTYSYKLVSAANGSGGTDWYLDPETATVSPGTRTVMALFNTAPTVWLGELTSLRSRMGELRFNGGKSGAWGRTYGNKYNVDAASGTGYKQTQQGFSLGADAPLPVGDGQWLIGAMAGHSNSDLNLSRGSSGTVKSYYVGAYTTWLDADTGYYFDGVLKLNRFHNEAKVSMSDSSRAKGSYNTTGLGGSVEFGRHIKLDNNYFIEPYTQFSTVVIQGQDYGLNNGMQAEGDRTRSFLGKVGMTGGRNFTLDDGTVLQPYVRLAMAHEFAKNNEVQVNNNVFNNDLSGSRGELGAGIAAQLSERLQLHADFDYANGKNIEMPFGANVGLRYSW